MQRQLKPVHALCGCVFATLLAWCCLAQAAIPHKINYQGYLTSSVGTPITASLSMVFKLYTVSSGGVELYSETQTVPVTNGLFNVTIGAVTALTLQFEVPYYLGIKVGAEILEMAPRQLVTASPYSLRSANADALGSVGNLPVEISVNSTRVMRFELNSFTANVIGGNYANSVTASAYAATIAGGGVLLAPNQVTDHYGTVGGGYGNRAGNADGDASNSQYATVSGGNTNLASGGSSAVGGGTANKAEGYASTVAGGANNVAHGDYSFAAGVNATATHHRTFVWGGDAANGTGTLADGDFVVYAPAAIRLFAGPPGSGGCTLNNGSGWSCASDRALKTDIVAVDGLDLLRRVVDLPVAQWQWKSMPGIAHMGPMAQDFHAAFGLGDDATRLAPMDVQGVALGAIQGLNAKVEQQMLAKDAQIQALRTEIAELRRAVALMLAHGRRDGIVVAAGPAVPR